uniref:pectinesterase n=1 Tax=Davidia involucrata TaxID=16924 RepID=A0A5B7BTL8_DAVIN
MGDNNGGKGRRAAVLGVSTLVLVAMVVAVSVSVGNHVNQSSNIQNVSTASMKAITAICQPTDYKQLCINSLSSTNTTDPKELIRTTFQLAMNHINEAAKKSTFLQQLHHDPRTKKALRNCQELAEFAAGDLKRCFDQLGGFDVTKFDEFTADLKTWLSGAITHQETCLDGFESTTGDAGERMREFLKTAMELTSNALTMVTEISSALSSLDISSSSRRLLSEELPEFWGNAGKGRLLGANNYKIKPDLVVAKDGTGKYKTINEALEDIPKKGNKTFVVYIKEGVYEEKVQFNRSLTHLMIMGDGPTKTRITGRLNFIDGTPTFQTATVIVLGDHFIAKDIGFENTAGPEKHQAVALRVGADMSIFYNCHMNGYQDTLYVHAYRQFYRDCTITGTIDFLFGDSSALFQNCVMLVRKPMDNQQCIVTAQGRKQRNQPSGIVLQNCTITADHPVNRAFKSYLGRPWKQFSRTIIMESYIDDLIVPEGWLPWNGTFGLDTCNYAEFNNRGPASSKLNRVRWRGIKKMATARIQRYTASAFLSGNTWIRQTGVPYTPGLIFPTPKDNADDDYGNEGNSKQNKSDRQTQSQDNYIHAPTVGPTLSPKVLLAAPASAPTPAAPKPTFLSSFKKFFTRS